MQVRLTGARVPALDGVRGVAVLLVVAEHSDLLPPPAGALGVAVFFVLSGYLMTGLIARQRQAGDWSMLGFIGARAARLLPALLLLIVAYVAVSAAEGVPVARVSLVAASTALFVANYARMVLPWSLLSHCWSLAVEEQFYAVWPVVMVWLLRVRRPVGWLLGAAAVSALIRLLIEPGEFAFMSLPTNGYALLVGAALALAGRRRLPASLLVSGGFLLATVTIAAGPLLAYPAVFLAPIGALVGAGWVYACSSGRVRIFEIGWLRFVGRISYALYLWNSFFLGLPGVGTPAARVMAAGLAFAVATASTVLLEEPVRRWYARRLRDLPRGNEQGVRRRREDRARCGGSSAHPEPQCHVARRDVARLERVEGRAAH